MTAGRPKTDYIGRTFGLVTAVRRDGLKWWCVCECGIGRYYRINNLISHPPKTHRFCGDQIQYELALDSPRTDVYEGAS